MFNLLNTLYSLHSWQQETILRRMKCRSGRYQNNAALNSTALVLLLFYDSYVHVQLQLTATLHLQLHYLLYTVE